MATTSLNGDYSRVIPIVSSFFEIKDMQLNVREDTIDFLVANAEIKETFSVFLKELGKIGMIATAKRSKYFSRLMPTLLSEIRSPVNDGSIIISVSKTSLRAKTKRRLPLPLIFFITTMIFVFYDGLSRSGGEYAQTYASNPSLMAIVYTMSLMGILGIHELGHMIALKHYGIKASWPYFIPGIPGFWPTFGALITQRSNMTNRNVLFDVGIAGPVAGLIITVIVSIYGSSTSTLMPYGEYQRLSDENRLVPFPFNPSLLMTATLYITGKNVMENIVLVMSPVLFAAWIGFTITSINLIPAWQLDGGHIARATLGARWHKTVTYAGIVVLFALGFFPMAILVLIFSLRAPGNVPLDDVSPLSRKRKALFFVALGIAVIAAPIPTTTILPWA